MQGEERAGYLPLNINNKGLTHACNFTMPPFVDSCPIYRHQKTVRL